MNFPILLKLWLSPAAQLVGSLTNLGYLFIVCERATNGAFNIS
jgi:hypothetical protein